MPLYEPFVMNDSQLTRFLSKIEQVGACWTWRASTRRDGYGQFNVDGSKPLAAHRVAYRHFIGEPPNDLDLDHLCRNRRCVNPTHLEPVTRSENLRRGDTGKHARTDEHRASLREAWERRRIAGYKQPVFSDEARERIGAAHRGKHHSEEHKAKLRAAWVRRKARAA